MINIAAQIISVLFHPAVLSVITPIILILYTPQSANYSAFWIIYPLLFIFAVILFTLIGVKTKLFSNFDVTKRSERKPLYYFVILLSIIYLILLLMFNGPKSLIVLGVGVLIGAIIFELVNKKLKASIHVASISALMCMLALLYGGIFFLLPLLIPLVAWSRIHMKRHTMQEALVGGSIGVALTCALYLVIEYIQRIYG